MIKELLLRGMKPFFPFADADILREVVKYIPGGVYVGYEKGAPVCFCIVRWPQNPLDTPQVLHFYSEGTRAATRALVDTVLDKVKAKGYNKLRAINGSGMSDETWKRVFHKEGWEIKPAMTVFDFQETK